MTMIDDRQRPTGERAASDKQSRAASNPVDDDPLAELIRIVKEEDPFGDVLAWQPAAEAQSDEAQPDEAQPDGIPSNEAQPDPEPEEKQQPPAHTAHMTTEQPARRAPAQRQYAQPGAGAEDGQQDAPPARRRGPPPLEPVALEEALREFRDAPDEQYAAPHDEFDPAAVPDSDDYSAAEEEAGAGALYPAPEYPQADEQEPAEPHHAEAYYGEEIADEDDPYRDPAFTDTGHGFYAEDDAAPVHDAAYAAAPLAETQPQPAAAFAAPEQAPRGRRGMFFGAGVLLGLIVLAGLFITLFQSGGDAGTNGPLPVIRAGDGPSKLTPDNPGGANIPNQGRLVYNRVSGEEGEPDARIVSREEQVMDQPGGKAADRFPGLNGGSNRGEAVDKSAQGGKPAAASPGQNNSVTPQPRRVRTLTVGPDGSLSPAPEEAPAPQIRAAQPAPEPPAPRVAEETAAPARAEEPAAQRVRSAVPPTRPAPARADAAPAQPVRQAAAPEPVRRAQTPGAPLALNPNPVSTAQARPAEQAQPQARQQQVANAAPAATTSTPPAVASQGEYVVQLAARKSEEQALGAYNALKGQYSGLLGRYKPLIQRADLGDRGVYYRVRVGPMASADSANQLCGQLKAAGLTDCLVRRR